MMEKTALVMAALGVLLIGPVPGARGGGGHPAGSHGYGSHPAPCCGPYHRGGPAYRGPQYGYGLGYGYGYGWRGYGWQGFGPDRSAFGSRMSAGEARKLVQWLIRFHPHLVVGDVAAVDEGYEVTVVTRKGDRLVDILMVEKETAWVYPIRKD